MFHMDPVAVLDGDYFRFSVRMAARNYIQKRLEEEHDKQRNK